MEFEVAKAQLLANQKKVKAFSELTKAVNNNFSKSAILKLFEFTILEQSGVKCVAIFLREETGWELVVDENMSSTVKNINVQKDLIKFEVIQDVRKYPGDLFESVDFILPILHKNIPLAYILIGPLELSEFESIDETIHFIETLGSFVVISLENKRLFKRQLEQERVSKEIELAREVQKMLIPTSLPNNEFVDVKVFYQPHNLVGGDYYDFISIDDNTVAMVMCDVSGKGFSAGMLMANFQAQLRYLLNKYQSLEQIVDHLNFKINQITKGDRYLTMFLGVFEYGNRKLRYVSAGHNPSILLNQGDIIKLEKGCTIIGAFDSLPKITVGEIILESNAIIVSYTDGLTELENESNEMFGLDRICTLILKNEKNSMQNLIENIETEMTAFKGENDFNDDVSIMACKLF